MSVNKEMLGRFRFGTLKITSESIQNTTESNLNNLAAKSEQLVNDIRKKGDSIARIRLDEDKFLYCFVKNHKALLFVHDTEKDMITQRLTVDEMRSILKQQNNLELRLENQDRILSQDNRRDFMELLESAITPNGTRGSPESPTVDDDFDDRYQ